MWSKSDLDYHTNFDKDLSDKIYEVFFELNQEMCWDEVEPFITEQYFGLDLYYNGCKIHTIKRNLKGIKYDGSFLVALRYYKFNNE